MVTRACRSGGGLVMATAVALSCVITLSIVGARPAVAQQGFDIGGEIAGLYPGVEATLDAEVTNPHSFPIRVTSVSADVLPAGPGCSGAVLDVGEYDDGVVVPASSSTTVPLLVTMDADAPDACQGAAWPLRFTGTAVGSGTATGPGPLPRTGAGIAVLVAVAGGLLMAGFGLRRGASR